MKVWDNSSSQYNNEDDDGCCDGADEGCGTSDDVGGNDGSDLPSQTAELPLFI